MLHRAMLLFWPPLRMTRETVLRITEASQDYATAHGPAPLQAFKYLGHHARHADPPPRRCTPTARFDLPRRGSGEQKRSAPSPDVAAFAARTPAVR